MSASSTIQVDPDAPLSPELHNLAFALKFLFKNFPDDTFQVQLNKNGSIAVTKAKAISYNDYCDCENCDCLDDLVSDEPDGAELIALERERQINKEGFTSKGDDTYKNFQLIRAAICYAHAATALGSKSTPRAAGWPWTENWWKPEPKDLYCTIKPQDSIRMLTKAGALIAAEIDRLKRLEPNPL